MRLHFILVLLMCYVKADCQQAFSLPLKSLKLTSPFGGRIHPVTGKSDFHRGIDLSARCEPVLAVLPGVVSAAGFDPILGNYIKIEHGDIQSIYGHLRMACVRVGDLVEAGSFLGITGSTGRSTGEHLHFALKFQGCYVDPLRYLMRIYGSGKPNEPAISP
ncbi:M23 family metallopeptidase [Pedobacter sp. P26]|uniref:M23 family metallopeptidase n=1 Tax=Pedobacter sp. P26 TaxID=3423956 RepID=UPI003D67DD77